MLSANLSPVFESAESAEYLHETLLQYVPHILIIRHISGADSCKIPYVGLIDGFCRSAVSLYGGLYNIKLRICLSA